MPIKNIHVVAQGSSNWEHFLMRLRYRDGRLVHLKSNQSFILDSEDDVWVVYSGKVDLFQVIVLPNGDIGYHKLLFTAEPGYALFGLTHVDYPVQLLARDHPDKVDSQLLRISRKRWLAIIQGENDYASLTALLTENWLIHLTYALAPDNFQPLIHPLIRIENDISISVPNTVFSSHTLLWVTHNAGYSHLWGDAQFKQDSTTGMIPLTPDIWLKTAIANTSLKAINTLDYQTAPEFWDSLIQFQQTMAHWIWHTTLAQEQREQHRQSYKIQIERTRTNLGLSNLANILGETNKPLYELVDNYPLWQACYYLFQTQKIDIIEHISTQMDLALKQAQTPQAIADILKIRYRWVTLPPQWSRHIFPALLAFLGDQREPVVLLPQKGRKFLIYRPSQNTTYPLNASLESQIQAQAIQFYRPSSDGPVAFSYFWHYFWQINGSLWQIWVILGLAMSLLNLLPPILTGILFHTIIPIGEISQLWAPLVALTVGAVAQAGLQITQGQLLLRLQTMAESDLQAALMDRILKLPITFFRQYTVGDLSERILGVSSIYELLFQAILPALVSAIFALPLFALLFFYATQLAWLVMGLFLGGSLVIFSLIGYQVQLERKIAQYQGDLTGDTLQYFHGLAKLRVAGAETRTFINWVNGFTQYRLLMWQHRLFNGWLQIVLDIFPAVILISLFTFISTAQIVTIPTGYFLAFLAVVAQLTIVFLQVISAGQTFSTFISLYERVQPVLKTAPEVQYGLKSPGQLSGKIEISHVDFQYLPEGERVLNDVSLHFEAGEFVALVGPSGAGKSSLFRLLIGFEQPQNGVILYDDQDLSDLDVSAVRRQIGVVLQKGQLMVGDIFSNIVGNLPLTVDDAWEAAEMVGMADDIRQMPMGMRTAINEGGTVLSGGQRQRLLIARAIIHKPRILLFDEATSALDNQTQLIVSRHLEKMPATRIVIAHRLSTIRQADRIYVFQNGQIVQVGTYNELIKRRGLFAELAKRQL